MPNDDTTNMRKAMMAEIVAIVGICGGDVPESESEFWRELTLSVNCPPKELAYENARLVIESLGELWNEDYVESDSIYPTLGALEVVHDGMTRRQPSGRSTASDESFDLDDEADDGLTARTSLNVRDSNMSVTSVIEMIRTGRLILNPEWQRSFVWKPRKQQALIESMLYGLPIPSFLLYKGGGKMFVIDGRQRLETISRFMGPVEERGARRVRFKTFSAKQEGWRTGEYLHEAAGKYYQDLPEQFKLDFDIETLQVSILDVELSQLYQIFKRYNTGSVALNAAEIRNAVYQSTPLHELMFRIAGEHRDPTRYSDAIEKRVSEDFRGLMRNKSQRYGAYDFIGRFFAFTHESTGSVAKATVSFMDRHADATPEKLEEFRQQFINALNATIRWYEYPLTNPIDDGQFHAWLATIQMVSAVHCLKIIATGAVSEENIASFISQNWNQFAENRVLVEKQNSTNFWKFQRMWIEMIDSHVQAIGQSVSA